MIQQHGHLLSLQRFDFVDKTGQLVRFSRFIVGQPSPFSDLIGFKQLFIYLPFEDFPKFAPIATPLIGRPVTFDVDAEFFGTRYKLNALSLSERVNYG